MFRGECGVSRWNGFRYLKFFIVLKGFFNRLEEFDIGKEGWGDGMGLV